MVLEHALAAVVVRRDEALGRARVGGRGRRPNRPSVRPCLHSQWRRSGSEFRDRRSVGPDLTAKLLSRRAEPAGAWSFGRISDKDEPRSPVLGADRECGGVHVEAARKQVSGTCDGAQPMEVPGFSGFLSRRVRFELPRRG